MHLDPDCAVGGASRCVPDAVVPSGGVRVAGLADESRIQVDASGQSAWIGAGYPRTIGSLECLNPAATGTIDRGGCRPHRFFKAHESLAVRFRAATSATTSPTCPENSVSPPHPAS